MKGKSLSLKEIGRVRRAMRPLLEKYKTQRELAKALDVCQQTVSAVLGGVSFPGIRFAMGVAKATGQSVEALLTTPSAPASHAA